MAYFFLRAFSLLRPTGTLGLIATNTLAQGDTREVGLDRMAESGFTITRAIQSRTWPAKSANLEYAAIWGTRGHVADEAVRVCDDAPVARISTLLEPEGRVSGAPERLAENADIAFIGCYVLGKGFILGPEEAQAWIAEDPRNAEVLFPYLNGKDLNSRPDCSASRWVIDFDNRNEDRAGGYILPFSRVIDRVKSERLKKNQRAYRVYWWQFAHKGSAWKRATAGLDKALVIAQTSATLIPARVPTNQVFYQKLVVFSSDRCSLLALLTSSIHWTWAVRFGSTMRTDPVYTPTDVFETFPRPEPTEALETIGRTLDAERREIMARRDLGLTKLYNLVNDPDLAPGVDPDVDRLRQIHRELDEAVTAAYGWQDIPLNHGFHTYRKMTRWTVSPAARVELLDRLLEENHRRAAAQAPAQPTTKQRRKRAPAPAQEETLDV